ncbi:MAG: AzlD domain-containing protein [Clostridia bacterium]|nr:AzlD domain-containing protein [Clostridia bacterium]
MSGLEYALLILGMTLVTYLPRAVPAILVNRVKFSGKTEKFLKLIPYTAMAALIFPGVFTVDENPLIGIVGGAAAAVLAWRKCPVMVCVLAAIAVDFMLYLVI